MKVTEIYESIQGEGPDVGLRAVFLRLWGCNLGCRGCDSKYSWSDSSRMTTMTVDEILRQLWDYANPHLIITGGEPLLQWEELRELLVRWWQWGWTEYVGLETNGTVKRFDFGLFSRIVVSPKRLVDLEWWLKKVQRGKQKRKLFVKIVSDGERWGIGRYPMDTLDPYLDMIDSPNVYFMPQGVTVDEVARSLEGIRRWMWENGIMQARISPRLHITAGWR